MEVRQSYLEKDKISAICKLNWPYSRPKIIFLRTCNFMWVCVHLSTSFQLLYDNFNRGKEIFVVQINSSFGMFME